VGRTQQILYFLRELWREGRLREIPVYVDSPLATKATDVHEAHPECYDAEARDLFRRDEEPFDFGRVRYVADVDESKRLNRMEGPVIIISASGMCEAGRVLHHLKHSVADERNVVLIVGFQAEHTLGRRLVKRRSPVRIFGREYPLRAEVRSIQALSAHADREELLEYFRRMDALPERAFVVHGEPDQSGPFAEALRGLGVAEVTVPAQGEEAEA
jgi:metallo-beta-lactamase family protein